MSFRDPHLPQIMKSFAKLSYECTTIFGSNAAEELVPVHFQAYVQFEAGQKRDAERAYRKMTLALAEKESFRRKMAKIDKADTNDKQSPPSNPMPL